MSLICVPFWLGSASTETIDQTFQIFLAAGAGLGFKIAFVDIGGEVVETLFTRKDRVAEIAVPTGIAFGNMVLEGAILEQGGSIEKAAGDRVHRSDMSIEQVLGIERLAADLGIKSHAAGGKAAGL